MFDTASPWPAGFLPRAAAFAVALPRMIRRFLFVLGVLAIPLARAESVFPLARGAIPATSLPPPYGLGVGWYRQEQDYSLDQLSVALPGGFPTVGTLAAENETQCTQVRPHLWVLPYLEVFALLGRVRSETVVRNIPLLGQVTANTHGTVHGIGATLAGGYRDWFGSVSPNYSKARMSGTNSSLRTLTVETHFGRNFGPASLWFGPMYQDTQEKTSGTFTLPPLGAVPYAVTLGTADEWNWLVGGQWRLNRHVALVSQVGLGQRRSLFFSAEFGW